MVVAHLVFVALTFFLVLYADQQGLLWFLGRKERLDRKRVEVLHVLVSIGLVGILLTGGLMFIDRATYLLSEPVFLVKMAFVTALVINGFFIGRISHLASEKIFRELPLSERRAVLLSAGVSGIGWVGAISCGFLLSFG